MIYLTIGSRTKRVRTGIGFRFGMEGVGACESEKKSEGQKIKKKKKNRRSTDELLCAREEEPSALHLSVTFAAADPSGRRGHGSRRVLISERRVQGVPWHETGGGNSP